MSVATKKKIGTEKGKNEMEEKKGRFAEALDEFRALVRSRFQLLYIISQESEYYLVDEIYKICQVGTAGKKYKKDLVLWDVQHGFFKLIYEEQDNGKIKVDIQDVSKESTDAIQALEYILTDTSSKNIIYCLLDFHHYMGEADVQRRLRFFSEYSDILRQESKTIVMLSSKNDGMERTGKILPPELENLVHLIEWPYPGETEIRDKITKEIVPNLNKQLADAKVPQIKATEEELDALVNSCKGLTLSSVSNVANMSVIRTGTLSSKIISKHKKQIITKNGLLDYIESEETLDNLGGLDMLKKWLIERKPIMTDDATRFGCDLPNGVLMIGPWGSGKTTAAKCVINEWGFPGLRIDPAKIFDQYVGSSERNIREILNLAESIAPCVLWWDEIDNFFSGNESSNQSDGGTTSRVIGIISTWMSEHEGLVFNIFTANDISQKPPKLFRKGRLDEIFILDLPVLEERIEIFRIHILKRLAIRGMQDQIKKFNLEALAKGTVNFSGAEIQDTVNKAVIRCFNQDKRDLSQKDLTEAMHELIPMAVTMEEQIMKIRNWQEGRAVCASSFKYEKIRKKEEYAGMRDVDPGTLEL